MNTANAQPDRRPTPTADGAQRSPVLVVAGIAFLVLFAAWIPLRQWIVSLFGEENDLAIGLTSAALWLLVFALVVGAVVWSRTALASWQTRDLVLTAVIGAVFGVVFSLWTGVYAAFQTVLGPWNDLIGGVWWLPGILVPYIVRKPGAALVAESLAAFISFLAGSPYGLVGAVITGIIEGQGKEKGFMLTGWRRYDLLTLVLAGVAGATTGFVYLWPIYYLAYSTDGLLITYAAYVIGVVVLASIAGKLLGDALLATGVLDRFAIGRERRAKQLPAEF
jgi:energy-coupling factor transport system substrate-specific component